MQTPSLAVALPRAVAATPGWKDALSMSTFDVGTCGLPQEDLQELKEAVADAILEQTRKMVSGEGDYGAVIYGQIPARALSSGFLIPRFNIDGLDESNDIRIPTHGIDFRVRKDANGLISVAPSFNVYVRAMPTEDDLFTADPDLGLRPRPKLKQDVDKAIKQRIRDQMKAEHPDLPRGKLRSEIQRRIHVEVMKEAGAFILDPSRLDGLEAAAPDAEQPALLQATAEAAEGQGGEPAPAAGAPDAGADLSGEYDATAIRFPDHMTVARDIPLKHIRLNLDLPVLVLPLPFDQAVWAEKVKTYGDDLRKAVAQAYESWIASPSGQDWGWRKMKAPQSAFDSPAAWEAFLKKAREKKATYKELAPDMKIGFTVAPVLDRLDRDILAVRVILENLEVGNDEVENGLFQAYLKIEMPDAALVTMNLERVRRSYHLSGFLRIPAVGVNGGVTDKGVEKRQRTLLTTWAPRFVLPRLIQTDIDVPVRYADLSNEKFPDFENLQNLPQLMSLWVEEIAKTKKLFEPGEARNAMDDINEEIRFKSDVNAWRAEAERIKKGVDLLLFSRDAWLKNPASREGMVFRAWLAMNRTFLDAAGTKYGPHPGWRLFQLAFILAHLPTLASREDVFMGTFDEVYDEQSASLLYMSTGGGKSEAFFGVVTFALFFDRIRGKHRGVTAMLRYPLRLLTIQQAQRLMRLIAKAELARRTFAIPGEPFEIGFWVGSGNTPNTITKGDDGPLTDDGKAVPVWNDPDNHDEAKLLKGLAGYAQRADMMNKLPKCPFCGEPHTVIRRFRELSQRIGIICPNDGCDWNKLHAAEVKKRGGRPEPLPFLLIDQDIYRQAPAILLGTIDKLALVGNSATTINKIAGMFGLAKWRNRTTGLLYHPSHPTKLADIPADMEPVAPAYAGGVEVFYDPFPSICVTDEMHLLEESLGTFGGLFETTLLELFQRFAEVLGDRCARYSKTIPRMPKHIVATATISDPQRQVQMIYQRQAVQFPHPGPGLYRSFYTDLSSFPVGSPARKERCDLASTAIDLERGAPWARIYCSLLTNGKPHTSVSITVLSTMSVVVTKLLRNLVGADVSKRDAAVQALVADLSDNPWRYRHAAVLDKYRAAGRFDILANLVDLHRIGLVYTTNKKGGDQIMSALRSQAPKDHAKAGYPITDYRVELISGGVDVKGIQKVIEVSEEPLALEAQDVEKGLRNIVATSAISHGVDVERFNSMVFAGLPSDIAEYIQASSRVGRTHVGFSLLLPTPQTRRDRFVAEIHEPFHRLLERMIAPPAIERWADKAVARSIPSLFQAYMFGARYQTAFAKAGEKDKAKVRFPSTAISMAEVFAGPGRNAAVDDIVDFIARAVGVEAAYGGAPASAKAHYLDQIRKEVEKIVGEFESGKYASDLIKFWKSGNHGLHHPMRSLRDVDAGGDIVGVRVEGDRKFHQGRMNSVMKFLRNRRMAGRRSAAGGGEMDFDTAAGAAEDEKD